MQLSTLAGTLLHPQNFLPQPLRRQQLMRTPAFQTAQNISTGSRRPMQWVTAGFQMKTLRRRLLRQLYQPFHRIFRPQREMQLSTLAGTLLHQTEDLPLLSTAYTGLRLLHPQNFLPQPLRRQQLMRTPAFQTAQNISTGSRRPMQWVTAGSPMRILRRRVLRQLYQPFHRIFRTQREGKMATLGGARRL